MVTELLYLREGTVDAVKTKYGYNVYRGIEEAYRGASCRNKVVFRLDAMRTLRGVFSEENLIKNRTLIFGLISGLLENQKGFKDKVETYFMHFYESDAVFRKWLGITYYFTDVLKQESLYDYFIRYVREEYVKGCTEIEQQVSGASAIYESVGYVYFACNDRSGTVVVAPDYGREVISHAKAWECTFQEA